MGNLELFSEVMNFPDPEAKHRYDALIGVDDVKERLVHEAMLLLDHEIVSRWSNRHHGTTIPAAKELMGRPPLIILAGDVGTGKTEVAETFIDEVTRQMSVDGMLYTLSLAARGQGAVGQMSSLVGNAFKEFAEDAKASYDNGKPSKISILLVDEGDALAQSRESSQMHHEDRAGVNALIKGIDGLRRNNVPALVIICTNRLEALDPAIRRRAAFTVVMQRPNDSQRRSLLSELLSETGASSEEMDQLVAQTGPSKERAYGYTYSDIRQRLIPEAVLAAISQNIPLTADMVIDATQKVPPTRPFSQEGA